jgi:hypothetical protein
MMNGPDAGAVYFKICGTPKAKYPTTNIYNYYGDQKYPNAASTSITYLKSTSVVKGCNSIKYPYPGGYNLCWTGSNMRSVTYIDPYDGVYRTGYVKLCSLRSTTTTNLAS